MSSTCALSVIKSNTVAPEHRWCYLEPPPELALSPEALFAILVAQKTLATYRGTPFETPLQEVFEKFSGDDSPVFHCSWAFLSQAITIKNLGIPAHDLTVYRRVVLGIATQHEIRFRYKGRNDDRARIRRTRPYHLCCANNSWYLIAFDHESGAIRTFALPRIGNVSVLETTFIKPPANDFSEEIQSGFGIFFEAQPETISVRFSKEIAAWVSERQWHSTQKIHRLPDGEVAMEMSVGVTPEIEQWLLSFGEHAAVLEPKHLAMTIRERLKKASRQYPAK